MGGLLPSWNHFTDGLNSVSRPAQMGPIWMEASHVSGMPINSRIWISDPPASSYLACIAVKCVALQEPGLSERYLRLLREAVMLQGKNIARQSVLLDLATQLATENPAFNVALFRDDLKNDRGIEAFRNDLNEVQSRGINRFPTLILRRALHAPLLITGYRPYTALQDVMLQLLPDIKEVPAIIDADAYKNYWGSITERELEEAVGRHEVLKK